MSGERLLAVCHLDVKMVPYFEALVAAGAEVWACAANPATTRDVVAEHLDALGVRAPARFADPPERHAAHLRAAISAGPTLLSEMGADATAATGGSLEGVRGGLEATATGRDGAVPFEALARCKSGAFLANLGHTSGELPVAGLSDHLVGSPRPHVERCEVEGRTLYLLAGGAMFNLAAGPGDPYDTFDLVTALMLEATGFLVTEGVDYPPGVHLLPRKVQDRAARIYSS